MNKFICIHPSGEFEVFDAGDSPWGDLFREKIGCSCLEMVYTVLPNICILVDESGKIKDPPQLINPCASTLYRGTFNGDPIFGPAVVVALRGECDFLDWAPLNSVELMLFCHHFGIF